MHPIVSKLDALILDTQDPARLVLEYQTRETAPKRSRVSEYLPDQKDHEGMQTTIDRSTAPSIHGEYSAAANVLKAVAD